MNNFKHQQFAHCESGVMSSLLKMHGINLSEPMVFGLSSSLFFVYLPLIKLNNLPLISYRAMPKNIINKLPNLLGVKIKSKTFSSQIKAKEELDNLLKLKKIVGLQTSVFYLSYFPKDMRFHFNAHNLLVLDKNEDNYIISDPVFPELSLCDSASLLRARFAKGAFAPRGFLYFFDECDTKIDLKTLLKNALRKNANKMLSPFMFVGVKGIRVLAKKLLSLDNLSFREMANYLTHLVRMQEEIGTGGGGFRYLYAAFLQEACEILQDENILKASLHISTSGDMLREFALMSVNACKNPSKLDLKSLSEFLVQISHEEQKAFEILKRIK